MLTPILRGVTAGAALFVGVAICGSGSAAAEPLDYGALPVDPNHLTDSSAYIAETPVLNPDGQQGITAVYTHRDGSRIVTDTIVDLPDAQAATDALSRVRGDLGGEIPGAATQPVPVGTDGTITSGMSADGARSIAVLAFVQGDMLTTVRFQGPSNDPAPADLITDYGRMQAEAIAAAQTGA